MNPRQHKGLRQKHKGLRQKHKGLRRKNVLYLYWPRQTGETSCLDISPVTNQKMKMKQNASSTELEITTTLTASCTKRAFARPICNAYPEKRANPFLKRFTKACAEHIKCPEAQGAAPQLNGGARAVLLVAEAD